MILYIDSTDFNSVTYALKVGQKIVKKVYKVDPHKSYETLGLLEKFLKSEKLKVESIKKIITNKGPGSYTGTRVGVAHAMALGFAWGIPVKFLEKEKFAHEFTKK